MCERGLDVRGFAAVLMSIRPWVGVRLLLRPQELRAIVAAAEAKEAELQAAVAQAHNEAQAAKHDTRHHIAENDRLKASIDHLQQQLTASTASFEESQDKVLALEGQVRTWC